MSTSNGPGSKAHKRLGLRLNFKPWLGAFCPPSPNFYEFSTILRGDTPGPSQREGATPFRTQHPARPLASAPVLGPKPWSPQLFSRGCAPDCIVRSTGSPQTPGPGRAIVETSARHGPDALGQPGAIIFGRRTEFSTPVSPGSRWRVGVPSPWALPTVPTFKGHEMDVRRSRLISPWPFLV